MWLLPNAQLLVSLTSANKRFLGVWYFSQSLSAAKLACIARLSWEIQSPSKNSCKGGGISCTGHILATYFEKYVYNGTVHVSENSPVPMA